jgi:hypothetical protein
VRVTLVAAGAAACALLAGCSEGPGSRAAVVAEPPAAPAPVAARAGGVALVHDGPATTARGAAPAGGRAVVALRLANASAVTRTVALRAGAPWLSVAASVSVPPRQSVPLTAVARPPADAAPGVMRSEVVARVEGDRAAAVSVSYESSVPVVVRVTRGRP